MSEEPITKEKRQFPIQPVRDYHNSKIVPYLKNSIPWEIAEKAYAEYVKQYGTLWRKGFEKDMEVARAALGEKE